MPTFILTGKRIRKIRLLARRCQSQEQVYADTDDKIRANKRGELIALPVYWLVWLNGVSKLLKKSPT